MKKNLFLAILFLTSFIVFSQNNNIKTQKVIQNQGITDPSCSGYVYVDNDFDGYGSGSRLCVDLIFDETLNYVALGGDCDDTNPSITIAKYWYLDADADGFGGTPTATKLCARPNASYIAISGDCNDTNAAINPNTIWYRDADNDTFGNPVITLIQCVQPVGYVLNNTDCNDSNNTILSSIIWYYDGDVDGFGNPNITLVQCTQPVGYVSNNTDCNDSNSTQNINYTWYSDSDGDGFGDPSSSLLACVQPANYVSNNQDECPTMSGTLLGCVVSPATTSFGNTQNYILTITPKQPVASVQNITNVNDVNKVIVYYDGLGRPMQEITNAQSNSGKDIVTHIEYDAFGRQTKEYLPFPSSQNTLTYIDGATAQSNTISFYQTAYGDMNPYSEKLFEASPLDKVFKQAAPGNSWSMGSGHEIKFDYETNTASEVKLIQATATWNTTLGLYDIAISNPGNYAANELYKTVTKNENWTSGTNGTTQEFKDKEGKVILKRTFNTSTVHDTYYVYDQYGNLTYVIPPLAEAAIDLNTLNGLCYQYKYDNRNRLVEKKLPGKQWEFIVYDKLDRPVATGPALSPFTSPIGDGWMVTKYDAFNRAILTGWQPATINSAQRKTLQNAYNATTILNETKATASTTVNLVVFNYTNLALPISGYHVLTVNYYDDYVFPNAGAIPTAVEGQTVYYNNTQKPKGLATGSWVRVLETTSLIKAETNLTFYDYKARPIRVRSNNHSSGYTEIDSKLDFSGKTLYTITRHKKDNGGGSVEIVTKEEYNYSAQDRLLTNTHQITSTSNPKQLLLSNTYDELGQLITKKVGGLDVSGAVGLQKVDYKYNIRGWLKEINNVDNLIESITVPKDLFAFKINYNDNPITGLLSQETAVPQLYNGNISETVWRTASDDKKRKYGYVYDDLNRLNNAVFQDPTASIVTNSFNENLTYDKNGNILSLNRNDYIPSLPYNTAIDNLIYSYHAANKNQLVKVVDSC